MIKILFIIFNSVHGVTVIKILNNMTTLNTLLDF